MDTWLEIDADEEELLLLSTPETSPRCTYDWDTEDEDALLLTPPEAQTTEFPKTPGRSIDVVTTEEKQAEVHTPKYEPNSPTEYDGLPPTPGRGTVWETVTKKIRVPIKSNEEKPYQVRTENGSYFEITPEEFEKVPFTRIRKMKKTKYTVFLKNNRSVRIKVVGNEIIWFNYRERSIKSE